MSPWPARDRSPRPLTLAPASRISAAGGGECLERKRIPSIHQRQVPAGLDRSADETAFRQDRGDPGLTVTGRQAPPCMQADRRPTGPAAGAHAGGTCPPRGRRVPLRAPEPGTAANVGSRKTGARRQSCGCRTAPARQRTPPNGRVECPTVQTVRPMVLPSIFFRLQVSGAAAQCAIRSASQSCARHSGARARERHRPPPSGGGSRACPWLAEDRCPRTSG
jgi:hypothetical protein